MKNLNKFLVLFLSFILVFTTLNFTPFTREALASEVEGSLEQEPPIEEKAYPTFERFAIGNEKVNAVDLSVHLSEPLELNQNTLYIYQVGESEPVKTVTKGQFFSVELPRSPTEVIEYYGSIGSSTSVKAAIFPLNDDNWNINASIDRNNFKTDDSTLPIISWNLSKNLNVNKEKVYITDSSGRLLHESYSSKGNYQIKAFYMQSEKYRLYIGGKSVYTRTNISQINNIQAASKELSVLRDPYEIESEITKEYTTANSYIDVSWSANQNIAGGTYSLFLVDEDTKKIVASKNSKIEKSGTISFKPSYFDGRNHKYRLYLGLKKNSGLTLEDIEIEASGLLLNTKNSDWIVELSTDRPVFYTEENTPNFYIRSNQTVVNSGYKFYLVNLNTGKIIHDTHSESYTWAPRVYTGDPVRYQVFLAKSCMGGCTKNPKELEDVIAKSNIVTIARGPWEISISSPKYYSTKNSFPLPRSETNQIFSDGLWNSNRGVKGNYTIYYCNYNTKICDTRSSNVLNNEDKEYKIVKYKAYVAAPGGSLININELQDIQAEVISLK